MEHSPLCCVISIPKNEATERLSTLKPDTNIQSVHKNNKNNLNSKKDIIIQSMFQSRNWNQQKKKINLYEKFNSYPNGVVRQKACSRAYFKIIEMSKYIQDFLSQSKPLRILSLAEAPGGFLQALDYIRKSYESSFNWEIFDHYCAVTMKANSQNVPDWSPDVVSSCKFRLFYQDILDDSFDSILTNESRFDLITGDCGIDVSDNFHQQELRMYPFLLAQTEIMLRQLQPGGCFILKLFETDCYQTKELLYFIGCCFRQVVLLKPRTSRPLNSERYLICRNFQIRDFAKANRLAELLQLYRKRPDQLKGVLWKTSIPEQCMYLFHGYSRLCKEITNRHLQLIMKKIGDDVLRLQYNVAYDMCKELGVTSIMNPSLEH